MLRWHLSHKDKIKQYRSYEKVTGCQADEVKAAPKIESAILWISGKQHTITGFYSQYAWDGFWALTDSRRYTIGGAGAIPYSEVSNFLDEKRIFDHDDRTAIRHLIKCMDREFLDSVNQPMDKKTHAKQ